MNFDIFLCTVMFYFLRFVIDYLLLAFVGSLVIQHLLTLMFSASHVLLFSGKKKKTFVPCISREVFDHM